jgi:hypothetical protein
MVVDGAVPLLVCIILTICPPGAAFGSAWAQTSTRYNATRHTSAPLHSPRAPYEPYPQPYTAHAAQEAAAKKTTPVTTPTSQGPARSTMSSMVSYTKSVAELSPIAKVTPIHSLRGPPGSHLNLTPRQGQGQGQGHGQAQAARKPNAPRRDLVDGDAIWD